MGIRNIAVTLTGDGSSLSRALIRSGSEIDTFTKKVESGNARQALSWKRTGAAVVTVAAVLTATAGHAAAQFESRMRNVNSLLVETGESVGVSEARFRSMSDSVLDLTSKLPQSANVLAEGLYDITSSGFSGAEALFVLNKSAEAASAGLTTTGNAAQAIDAVLNAYGLSAASAGQVSDVLFQTVNEGVISFEQLTGVIGDTVGTAAAAGVDIAQVGSAIATMTLSGLSAAESGTSLNRVLQSLIQPSASLAATYKQLGIESGAVALKNDGLRDTIERIRKVTGGSIASLLQLFPEVRAARGALALMSDEGRTYVRVSGAIEDENARQGATHRALNEQMKATSAQLRIFENDARRAAIVVGTKTLPVFVAFLRNTRELGQEAIPLLERGVSAITPMFDAIYRTGQNIVEIVGELLHGIEPLAAELLKIGAGAIIGGLTTLAKALEVITGFLADHEQLVLVLGAAYVATLLPSVAAVTVAFNRFILTPVVLGLADVAAGAGTAAAGLRTLTASMLTLQGVATLGVAIGLYSIFRALSAVHEVTARAHEDISKITQDFNALDSRRAQTTIEELRHKQLEAIETSKHYTGLIGTWKAGWNVFAGDKSVGKIAQEGREAGQSIADLESKIKNTSDSLAELSTKTGLSVEALRQLALKNNIDLSDPFATDEAIQGRLEVLGLIQGIGKESKTAGAAIEHAAGVDIDAWQRMSDALADVQKKVADVFARDTDVFSSFDPKGAADKQEAASQRVAAAEQHLNDVRARAAAHAKRTVSDTIALRNAQDALSEAQSGAARSAGAVTGDLAAAYRETLRMATRFADDIQKAQRKGLDPGAITRLLELGPRQAGPILQRLVGDHSGRLIELVNRSEQALARISARVVEQGRLTTLAMNAQTDEQSRDLTAALRVSAEAMAQGGKATVDSVARALHLTPDVVNRIRDEFGILGIKLNEAVQAGLDSQPLKPPVVVYPAGFVGPIPPGAVVAAGPHRASGGLLEGPGTTTSDSILARVSRREFVQPARAVDYYGVDFMERLRRLQVPRFAEGGMVGRTTVVKLSTPTQHSVRHQQDINGPVIVQGIDMDDAFRQIEEKKRRRGWSGGARRD